MKKYIDTKTQVLVYKQTVLPLVEHVSFMLYLSYKRDVEKFKKLQNRSLRTCYNINTPRDIRTPELYDRVKIEKLSV